MQSRPWPWGYIWSTCYSKLNFWFLTLILKARLSPAGESTQSHHHQGSVRTQIIMATGMPLELCQWNSSSEGAHSTAIIIESHLEELRATIIQKRWGKSAPRQFTCSQEQSGPKQSIRLWVRVVAASIQFPGPHTLRLSSLLTGEETASRLGFEDGDGTIFFKMQVSKRVLNPKEASWKGCGCGWDCVEKLACFYTNGFCTL